MPKLTWMNKAPPVNVLSALFRERMRMQRIRSDDVGKAFGCTGDNVRAMLRRPAKKWKVGDIMTFCDAIGVSYEEAFDAATR